MLLRMPLQNDRGPMLSLSDPIGGHFLGAFKFVERAPGTREISRNRTRGYRRCGDRELEKTQKKAPICGAKSSNYIRENRQVNCLT